MTNDSEMNQIIMEVIDQRCTDERVKKLIHEAVRFELNIWNRHIASHTILETYELMVDKIARK
jgi:hypothetical protein